MAAKICVPCDFGIENLHNPFHGNVHVEFEDDSKMKVNSLILSWNSETFCYFFNELRLTNVEVKDFSKDAVIVFLESMYSGNVNLTKGLFRDIYKLSVAFKAKWITDRCREFLCMLCELQSQKFEDLLFVFNEAIYAETILKTDSLIDTVVEHFSKIETIENLFVHRYLQENYTTITSATLEHLLLINKGDFSPFITVMIEYLIGGGMNNATRSLISNSKIVEHFANNMDCYEEVYELLALKITDNLTVDDFKALTNLNLSVIRATKTISKTDKKRDVLVKDIPNLFHDWNLFKDLSNEKTLEILSSVPNISYFMIFELCTELPIERSSYILQNLTQLCGTKSLCKVPRTFIQNVWDQSLGYVDRFTNLPQNVVSEDDTAVIVGTKTTVQQLVSTANLYKFYFRHPAAPHCENDTECGFILKVTPYSKEETGRFNIELVTEGYPTDIHCHEISAAHMHLVVEYYENFGWRNMRISWIGRPEYPENVTNYMIEWGSMAIYRDLSVRLVVYYDIIDRK